MHTGELLSVAMFATLVLALFSGFPVAYIIGGTGLLFGIIGWSFDWFSLIEFFNLVPRIWGQTADNLILVAIPCFIFMGIMLERSRIAADLLDVLAYLLRRVPGGLGLAVTLLGGIMAASTGIIGASVVMMTMMALPTMLKHGYTPSLASGTIASSATLGILIPPSIMLVMMGDLLSISVGRLFLTAVIPGVLLMALYSVYVMFIAWYQPGSSSHAAPSTAAKSPLFAAEEMLPAALPRSLIDPGMRGTPVERLAPMGGRGSAPTTNEDLHTRFENMTSRELFVCCIRALAAPVILICMVLGSIFGGLATPTEASGIGAFGAMLLALVNGKLNWRITREVCEASSLTIGMIFMIMIGATIFSYVFRSLGGEAMIVDFLNETVLGPWGTLSLLMVVIFFLGFFFDWIEITLIVLPIFGPVVANLDFGDHVARSDTIYWFAALMAINLQTSFLTPPFGMALFFMRGASEGRIKIQEIYRGVVPFVCLQLLGLVSVMVWPGLALWLQAG